MNNGKLTTLVFAVLACVSSCAARPASALDNPSFLYSPDTLPRNFVVDANFSSRLPILVFQPEGDVAPESDQNVRARLLIYGEPGGDNSLRNAPTAAVSVEGRPFPAEITAAEEMSRRGREARSRRESSSAVVEDKRTYCLDLVQSAGDPPARGVSLAGLPADTGWVLHGSMRDKGMLRTALAYELGGILFPDVTPAAEFCEVLLLLNGAYHYRGVHVLAQNAEKLTADLAARQPNPLLLRYSAIGRVRGNERAIRAGNAFFLAVPIRPDGAELSQDRRRRIGIELEKVEGALSSVSPNGFLTHRNYLDEESAVNFFILNTLMLNAFDRPPSFHLILDGKGRFRFIPDWQFELSLDNAPNRDQPLPFEREMFRIEAPSPLARRELAWRVLESGGDVTDLRIFPAYEAFSADNFIWIDRLFMSRSFVEGVHDKCNRLRQSVLSPDNILNLVNSLSARLDRAIERDWVRWRKDYAATSGIHALSPFVDEEGRERIRQTWSHDQELVKIAQCLVGQDALLLEGFTELNWISGELFNDMASGTRHGLYAIAMLAGLFLLSYIFTRRL